MRAGDDCVPERGRIATGQQARAAWRAHVGRSIPVGHDYAFFSEPVDIGRINQRGAEGRQVAVTKVVNEDDNDVRARWPGVPNQSVLGRSGKRQAKRKRWQERTEFP